MPEAVDGGTEADVDTRSSTGAPGWTLLAVCAAGVLNALDVTIVNIALERIGDGLDAGLDGLQWVVNAYVLAFGALLLTAASVSDLVGRKRIFLTGLATFTIASALCGAAANVEMLAVFRAVQGAGAAMTFAAAPALIAAAYQGKARTTAIGIFTAVTAASGALGPLIGGALVDALDWRWIFYVNVPIGVLVGIAVVVKLAESRDPDRDRRVDLVGAALVTTGLFSANYALLNGPDDGWTSGWVLTAAAAAAVLLAGFVLSQRRRGGMVDLGLFRQRAFTGAVVLSFLARFAGMGLLPFLLLWFQGLLGHSPFQAGLRLLPMSLTIIVVAALSGGLREKLDPAVLIAAGFAAYAVGFLLVARVDANDSWTVALPGLVLIGVGSGLVLPPLLDIAVGAVPVRRAGMATGVANSFFPLGTAAGVAVSGAFFSGRISDGLSDSALAGLGLPAGSTDQVRQAVEAGRFGLAELLPEPVRAPVTALARDAFTDGLSTVCLVSAVAGGVGVVVAAILVRGAILEDADEKLAAAGEAAAPAHGPVAPRRAD